MAKEKTDTRENRKRNIVNHFYVCVCVCVCVCVYISIFLLRYHWHTLLWRFHKKNNVVVTFSFIIKSTPHIPLQSLSISIVRCYRALFVFSELHCLSCDPHTPCVLIIIPLIPLFPPSPPALPHPTPLVTAGPFLESVNRCYFVPSFLLCCFTPQISEIIWHLSFSAWLISWAQYPLAQSILLQMVGFVSFLWLNSIPLCICTMSSLSIHILMDI